MTELEALVGGTTVRFGHSPVTSDRISNTLRREYTDSSFRQTLGNLKRDGGTFADGVGAGDHTRRGEGSELDAIGFFFFCCCFARWHRGQSRACSPPPSIPSSPTQMLARSHNMHRTLHTQQRERRGATEHAAMHQDLLMLLIAMAKSSQLYASCLVCARGRKRVMLMCSRVTPEWIDRDRDAPRRIASSTHACMLWPKQISTASPHTHACARPLRRFFTSWSFQDKTFKADVLCENGIIKAVGPDLKVRIELTTD